MFHTLEFLLMLWYIHNYFEEGMAQLLIEGSVAPDFELQNQHGESVSLSDYAGKKRIVYFYPKDNTPGCTRQACAFRDSFDEYSKRDIIVMGISKDGTQSHAKFADKHNLPFILLSDPTLEVIKLYDVWKEKTNFGVTALGVVRATYVISEDGIIIKVFKKASPNENAQDVLNFLSKQA